MKNSSFAVIDVETTGLSPRRNKLIEIHALRIDKKGKTKTFSSLINPGTSIPSFITRLTGITNDMVADSPPVSEVITNLANFLSEDDIIVGHNVSFDMRFLNHNFTEILGRPIENQTLCTLRLARRVYPELCSYRLKDLCDELKIESDSFHRAGVDVEVTKELMYNLYDALKKAEISDIKSILKFQKMPIAKASKILKQCQ